MRFWRNAALFGITLAVLPFARSLEEGANTPTLPLPTGAFFVGRTRFLWEDAARSGRPVKADVWYPASSRDGASGVYFPDLSILLESSSLSPAIRTSLAPLQQHSPLPNARDDAQLAQAGGPFPLLLFSPGLGGSPYDYSIQFEELASHGYIVIAVEHVHDTLAVVLANKQVIPFDGDLWARYASADAQAIKFYEERSTMWAEDLAFAMHQLVTLGNSRNSPFFHAVDTRRIGAFGHSLGGRAAASACMLDEQLKACLNEDGSFDDVAFRRPFWPVPNHEFAGEFAMLDWFDSGLDEQDYAGMHSSPVGYAKARLTLSGVAMDTFLLPRRGSIHITLLTAGMSHTSFTDLPWRTALSTSERTRYEERLDLIRAIVRDFFDQFMRERAKQSLVCGTANKEMLLQCYGALAPKP